MNIYWTMNSIEALSTRCYDFVPELVERIVTRYAPPVPWVHVVHDREMPDAGQFRFKAPTEDGVVHPEGILVNTLYCRTVHDLTYVLLHEIRHAHQLEKLGAEIVSAACSTKRFWTELGHKVEEDAAAWAIDHVPLARPGRAYILNEVPYDNSIYREHKAARLQLRVAWDL